MRQRSLSSRRGLTQGRHGYPLSVDVPGMGHMQWVSAAPTPPGRRGEAWYVQDKIFYLTRLRRWKSTAWNRLEIATGPPGDRWRTMIWVEL